MQLRYVKKRSWYANKNANEGMFVQNTSTRNFWILNFYIDIAIVRWSKDYSNIAFDIAVWFLKLVEVKHFYNLFLSSSWTTIFPGFDFYEDPGIKNLSYLILKVCNQNLFSNSYMSFVIFSISIEWKINYMIAIW